MGDIKVEQGIAASTVVVNDDHLSNYILAKGTFKLKKDLARKGLHMIIY